MCVYVSCMLLYVEGRFQGRHLPLFPFLTDKTVSLELTDSARLASKPQGFSCLCLPGAGITHLVCSAFTLKFKLRPSYCMASSHQL